MNDQNIVRLEYEGKEIILIPTAHISKKSAEQVKEVIDAEQPDSVCVELDKQRYNSIKDENRWNEMDIFQVIKEKKSLLLLVNLIISSFQSRMAEKMGINAGQEMMQGIKSAEEIGAELVLADRNIQITFKRVWRGLGFIEKLKLIMQIVSMIFFDEEITEKEMEEMKSSDSLNILLEEMASSFPGIKHYLLDERDQYLANKIKNAPGDKIVAVLGAAHVPGIQKEIYKEQDLDRLNKLPPKKNWGKIFSWGIPLLIGFIIISTFINNFRTGIEVTKAWFIWNGSLSALGVLLGRGHILTVLTAFLVAPLSSLNPTLAAGWFAGIVEAYVRKPKVRDFQELSKGISVKEIWANKVTKVLLIVVLANLGSVIGTYIGGASVIKTFLESLNL
ncbi:MULTISPECIES: TraB/GumN family protein [unclassified Halanaerobium]|uniref:TraB/GumN family protein n=1 Tax=unclassified Halanaerobium TaxID=2641197 RepID=UPI000DF2C5B7|nr:MULTISPECIES: TraB/GumN family protein [unclassified Halanaerobium]RCW41865.1 pheromone shutdown-related protein TraB [Halanaerobium sp. MA284_MarDTE_T2]RCW84232.1 pheromone shutdown-related protein TraB [Halanaerobium sp. DL-01]